MAVSSPQHPPQSSPQTVDVSTTAAAAPTFSDAVHLAKDVGRQEQQKFSRQASQRQTQNAVQRLRKQARVAAEQEYFQRRMATTNDAYNEASDAAKLSVLPRFSGQEIYCGEKLGNGAFGTVYEVLKIDLEANENNDATSNPAARKFMAQHCLRNGSERKVAKARLSIGASSKKNNEDQPPAKDARYAIKKLRSRIIKGDKELFSQAMIDVATETRILASIPHHPNIIKLRGIAVSSGSSGQDQAAAFPACCFHEDYFLVLDRLYGTLDDRLDQWTKQETRRGFGKMLWQRKQQDSSSSMHERLLACLDLASALAHLHRHNIIHRDIKPPNIGFNIRGDLTVFDFGLSRELPKEHSNKSHKSKNNNNNNNNNNKLFRMTGFCGSPRYMAPEVGLRKVYNAKCDVYSFGLLAWQILTLQKPYDDCDMNDLKYVVWPATEGVVGPGDWTKSGANKIHQKQKHHQQRYSDTYIVSQQQKSKRGLFSSLRSNSSPNSVGSGSSNKPKPISSSHEGLAKMIDRTFRRNIAARPTMKELEEFLRNECKLAGESSGDGKFQMPVREHSRRRSTFVFQQPPAAKAQQQQKLKRGKRSSVPALPSQPQRNREDSTHHGTDTMAEFSESSSYEEY